MNVFVLKKKLESEFEQNPSDEAFERLTEIEIIEQQFKALILERNFFLKQSESIIELNDSDKINEVLFSVLQRQYKTCKENIFENIPIHPFRFVTQERLKSITKK
jgi:predicted nucleotidyltransferase